MRAWSERNLKDRQNTLYYMFSGPDFLYANAFFPSAKTYLLSGLEPVGAIPSVSERTIAALPRIQQSIGTSLRLSFFITQHMRNQLSGGDLAGTLPILYVYIARSGKTIREVSLVNLDRDGNLHPAKGEARGMVPGVKIVLSSGNGPAQTLYYFRTDVSNGGVASSGFLKFAATLGNGHGLLKSASYLMHSGNFTQVRDFVLQHSQSDRAGRLREFRSRRSSRTSGISIRSALISGRSRSSPAAISRGSASCSRRRRRRRSTSASAIAIACTTSNLLLAVRKEQLKPARHRPASQRRPGPRLRRAAGTAGEHTERACSTAAWRIGGRG